ncbi:MAG TPA: hypothetical protein GXZ59_05715 [Clostridiaceae bacterium]|nr:hypothetical protein [Clostridiaceae bacterium]
MTEGSNPSLIRGSDGSVVCPSSAKTPCDDGSREKKSTAHSRTAAKDRFDDNGEKLENTDCKPTLSTSRSYHTPPCDYVLFQGLLNGYQPIEISSSRGIIKNI